MRRFVSVLIFVLLSFHAWAEESKCVSVSSGSIVLSDGTGDKVPVSKGTWCPDPVDKNVAKRITELDYEVKELKIKLDSSNQKLDLAAKYSADKDAIWEKKVEDLRTEVAFLSGPWNRYGRVILWCVVSAAASAAVTYGVVKLSEK